MAIEKVYTTSATAKGGRNGHVQTDDGVLSVDVRTPKSMGGPGGAYTNPEQLFAAGYAACFDSALNMVLRMAKVQTGETSVTMEVGIGKNGQGGFGFEIAIKAHIPDLDRETAQRFLEQAHQVCPYSNATRGNVEVTLELV